MCGRFALYSSPAGIQNYFATVNELDFEPHYNIAPSQSVPVIRADESGNRLCVFARWGLIPSWVKDTAEMQKPINAKAETAAIKPMFRNAYRKNRVLIPADAFYEWAQRDGKQPYLIKLKNNEVMGMGGLLETWHGYDTEINTFTILTTAANPLMSPIHDRMPVIIRPDDFTTWLDRKISDSLTIQAMTLPLPERLMQAYPVSRNINNPRHDSTDLISPLDESEKFNNNHASSANPH